MTDNVVSLFDTMEVARRGKKIVVQERKEPSEYQKAILKAVRESSANIRVDATAGSGKTSLLEMIAQEMELEEGESATFLSFAVHIVKRLKKTIPAQYDIRTVNSLGHLINVQNLRSLGVIPAGAQPDFQPRKYEDLMRELIQEKVPSPVLAAELYERLKPTVQLHVGHALGLDIGISEWAATMNELDAPVDGAEDTLYALTMSTLKAGLHLLRTQGVVSFIDQTLAPMTFGWKLQTPYTKILIDEVQDLSRAQLYLLKAASDERTRIIGVGDRSQAIMAFSGADLNSMDEFTQTFQAVEMPLSITYRCPKKHVALARHYTTRIEAAPDAKEGILEDISQDEMLERADVGDLILCRTTAPLIEQFYALIAQGRPALVRGRDIAQNLVTLSKDIATWNSETGKPNRKLYSDYIEMQAFEEHFDDFMQKTIDKINAEAGDDEQKQFVANMRVAVLLDKYSALQLVLEHGKAQNTGEFIREIRQLFNGTEETSINLSTVHKAKGLEADRVFIIRPDLLPHPKATSPVALESEKCLEFVAYTRAKEELYFVDVSREDSRIEKFAL